MLLVVNSTQKEIILISEVVTRPFILQNSLSIATELNTFYNFSLRFWVVCANGFDG